MSDKQADNDDPMGPPKEPCECWCMHCNRTFMSDGMWFQRVIGDPQGFEGFWMCPTPNCSGAGFCFDIFPADPNHPANQGWHYDDDDDDEAEYDSESDEELFDPIDASTDTEDSQWDPDETKWKELDDRFGTGDDNPTDDDDLEGEEWKHGLQPGEHLPEPDWMEESRLERENQERQYDEPDRRPREVDWSDREEHHQPRRDVGGTGGSWTEDDIPF